MNVITDQYCIWRKSCI